jgi:hypothetical protein
MNQQMQSAQMQRMQDMQMQYAQVNENVETIFYVTLKSHILLLVEVQPLSYRVIENYLNCMMQTCVTKSMNILWGILIVQKPLVYLRSRPGPP